MSLSTLATGCVESADEDLIESGGGKADNVASQPSEEPLEFETLQRITCEAHALDSSFASEAEREALMDRCHDLTFTVMQKTQSTLYTHKSSRLPVTLAMDILVNDGDESFEAQLFRVFGSEQRFVWRGIAKRPIDDATYLEEAGRALGALAIQSDLWDRRVFSTDWDDLPARIARVVDTEMKLLDDSSPLDGDIQVSQAMQALTLVRMDAGTGKIRTVGYGVPLDLIPVVGEAMPVLLILDTDGEIVSTEPADLVY